MSFKKWSLLISSSIVNRISSRCQRRCGWRLSNTHTQTYIYICVSPFTCIRNCPGMGTGPGPPCQISCQTQCESFPIPSFPKARRPQAVPQETCWIHIPLPIRLVSYLRSMIIFWFDIWPHHLFVLLIIFLWWGNFLDLMLPRSPDRLPAVWLAGTVAERNSQSSITHACLQSLY